jgi:3-dehydroquinate synthase
MNDDPTRRQVAAQQRSKAAVERVRVELGARSYDVLIGPGLMELGRVREMLPGRRVAVVIDSFVRATYSAALDEWRDCTFLSVAGGEASKSFDNLQRIVDELLAARLERNDVVVALGGGVIGDLAGFAAAITRRGMNFVQMPTTLLAQVDASVGGKTGINSRFGKNLVGAFHQPRLVLADTSVLDTLPLREFRAGYAEMVKAGLIGDVALFEWLEKNRTAIFAGGPARVRAISECVRFKAKTVSVDEQETGDRALLNLGHTFGHAIEAACGFDAKRVVHGEAVSIGIVMAHDFSADAGLVTHADAERARAHLKSAGLPVAVGELPGPRLSADELMHHMAQDKKVKRGQLTFILTRGIGKAFIAHDISPEKVRAFIEKAVA